MAIPDGHAFYCGKTRSGKTLRVIYNLKKMLDHPDSDSWSILIVNPKNSKDWNNILKPTVKLPKITESVFRINWVIKPHEFYLLDEILEQVYSRKAGKVLVIFDEGQTINDNKVPYAAVLWTQGLENQKVIWILAQRPAIVSRFAVTQSTYFYIYSIKGSDDIDMLDGFLSISLKKFINPERIDRNGNVVSESKKLERYHTLYYNDVSEKGEILEPCPDIRKDFVIYKPKPLFKPWILLIPLMPIIYLLKKG